jgi:hypothetical protein
MGTYWGMEKIPFMLKKLRTLLPRSVALVVKSSKLAT